MELIDKADILFDAWLYIDERDEWEEFVAYNQLGLPLAHSLHMGYILDLSPEGEMLIEDTYAMLCNVLKVSVDDEFASFEDMWNNADWSE